MSRPGIRVDIKGLEKFAAALEKSGHKVKLGVLGGSPREKGTQTNADILAKHEFGEDGMPVRSVLRMPLTERLNKELEASGLLRSDAVERALNSGSFEEVLKQIGLVGEKVIQQAFDTGGFGKWQPSNMEHKKVHQTLVETQQLRNSIVSKVEQS